MIEVIFTDYGRKSRPRPENYGGLCVVAFVLMVLLWVGGAFR